MNKSIGPKALTLSLMKRSSCSVQMSASIWDKKGRLISVGWNNSGKKGYGVHAEVSAISRANPKRLNGSTIYVSGMRKRNGKLVKAMPCKNCMRWIHLVGISKVVYYDRGEWVG